MGNVNTHQKQHSLKKNIAPWHYGDHQLSGSRPSIRTFHGGGVLNNGLVVVAGRNMHKRLNDTHILDMSDLAPGGAKVRAYIKETEDIQNNMPAPKPTSALC